MQDNVCIRCGKVRIFSRRWKEKVDGRGMEIIHEESVCPDPDCQKIVDEKFTEMRDRRNLLEDKKRNIKIGATPKAT